ncbi:MAG: hypothetical protein HYU66_15235 [Armatimonadetes bacterium]|nr:hypothetical protein [Armatimonadota bacterium]
MRKLSHLVWAACLFAGAAHAYWNYDPQNPPYGGPHRKINECAWKLLVITKVREAERPDPVLKQYKLKDDDLRKLLGATVTTPGNWPDDIVTGDAEFTPAGWIIEGGYTADEPEVYMCLRHFYDPTKPEGQRYLTDIPFLGKFREQVRSIWRRDVEVVNPTIDSRAWAFTRADNPWGWQQGLTAMRQALGQGDLTRAKRNRLAATAWRALGESMHLMADLTVAAHTRNDGHPGKLPAGDLRPDPYEEWALAPELQAAYDSIPRSGGWQKLDPFGAMDDEIGGAIAGAGSPTSLFHAVAAYVNRRFLTPDTLNGTDHNGNPIAPANGQLYPSPLLGREVVWDEGAGTYNATFARRGEVAMIKETWQSATWGAWLKKIGTGLSGATLTFGTTHDSAASQARVLGPIAMAANMRLIDWYLPRVQITITSIDASQPDKPLAGKVEHKPYGAWTTPIDITLPKDGILELYVDDRRQDPRDYELTVTKGVLAGKLKGVDLKDAKRIGVEMDMAGIRIASPDYTARGVVMVRVCKPQDQTDMNRPMNVLGGEPIPNVEVTASYTLNGKPATLRARTDKNGNCRYTVPLGVEVKVKAQDQEKPVTCTGDRPKQGVNFGWQGHDPRADEPPPDDNPYLTGEAGFEH